MTMPPVPHTNIFIFFLIINLVLLLVKVFAEPKHESLFPQELLQVVTKETRPGLMRRIAWVAGHLLAWILCLGSMLYCLRFVYNVVSPVYKGISRIAPSL